MTNLLLEIVAGPAMAQSQAIFQKLDYMYRQPARQGDVTIRDRILYMKEIFQDDDRDMWNLRLFHNLWGTSYVLPSMPILLVAT